MSAQVSSTVEEEIPSVWLTTIPRRVAAATSITGLRRPVVTISRSRSRRSITAPGSGVRSRISTTASYVANRSVRASASTT